VKKYVYLCCLFFAVSLVKAQEKELQLSMQEAVTYALANNYTAKIAVNNTKAAKKKKWETTTMGLPQIDAQIDYNHWLKQATSLLPAEIAGGAPGTFIPVTFGTQQTMNASVTLRQLIFDGTYIVGLQSANTYLNISEQAKEKTDRSVREAVINAYGNVLVAEKMATILAANKTILEKNVADTEKIYANGLVEEESLEQLKITLATVTSQVNNMQRLEIISRKMLNMVLGATIETRVQLTDTLEHLIGTQVRPSLATTTFEVEAHVDFKIAANNTEGFRLLLLLEKVKYLPSLKAFVNFGYTGNADTFNFLKSNQQWYDSSLVGVSLEIPVFSSFKRTAKIGQARLAHENAALKLTETKERLHLALIQAKSDYQFSIEAYQTATKNVALAQRIAQKQQTKFFEGLSTSFDLSQAQHQLYAQQQNYVQTMFAVIAKKAHLENALHTPLK